MVVLWMMDTETVDPDPEAAVNCPDTEWEHEGSNPRLSCRRSTRLLCGSLDH